MQLEEPIGIAITTFERPELTVKSFKDIISDPRISSVTIVDDHSSEESFNQLHKLIIEEIPDIHKVFLHRNEENIQMSRNKVKAVELSKEKWVLLGDSDNHFDTSYLDALELVGELQENTIYCPDFPRPNFVYGKFSGRTFDKDNIKELISDPMGNCCANTANYVVPRDEYIRIYQYNSEMKATDTIWMLFLWLKYGNRIHVVKDMAYDHLVWDGSGYMQDVQYNMTKGEEVRQLILSL